MKNGFRSIKVLAVILMLSVLLQPSVGKCDSERLNLWPLLSIDDDKGVDVLWPLSHFRDAKHWWMFPAFRDDHNLVIFPEFWFMKSRFGVLPLVADYDFKSGTLFPLLWWNFGRSETMTCAFPLYYHDSTPSDVDFIGGAGLFGYTRHGNGAPVHWLFPLYAKGKENLFTIPYSRVVKGHGADGVVNAFLCGFGGYETDVTGKVESSWLFPLWSADRRGFYSLPFSITWDAIDRVDSWFSPLLLSWATRKEGGWDSRCLLGLAGSNAPDEQGVSSSWVVPFYYADSLGTVITPFFGKSDDGIWGLPGWYKSADSFASPFWYQHVDNTGRIDRWMIPLLLSGGVYTDGCRKGSVLFNLAGWNSQDSGYRSSWLFPLYYANNDGTFVTPLFGYTKSNLWILPLWYQDANSMYSPFWCQRSGEDGSTDWIVPLLFAGGSYRPGGVYDVGALLMLFGMYGDESKGTGGSWLFPVYYANNDGTFVTPLFGCTQSNFWIFPLWYQDANSKYSPFWCQKSAEDGSTNWAVPLLLTRGSCRPDGAYDVSALLVLFGMYGDQSKGRRGSWLFPLYYEDSDGCLVTPLYASSRNDEKGLSHYWLPPLLSWYGKYDSGRSAMCAMLLYGHHSGRSGETELDYLFPLYAYEGKTGDFASLLFGWREKSSPRGKYHNCWWLTPLLGTRSGAKSGAWLFPLFNYSKDKAFDDDLALMDSPVLPERMAFCTQIITWTNSLGQAYSVTNTVSPVEVDSSSTGSILLFADNDHSVCGSGSGNVYKLHERSKRGNLLVFNSEAEREVSYFVQTGTKFNDRRESETTVLLGLYHSKSWSDEGKGSSYSRSRLLWKLWDREERDGEVTLDVFPGFTYDTKKNGYVKASWLWRLFRYESDPEKGSEVDVLFIPVWR